MTVQKNLADTLAGHVQWLDRNQPAVAHVYQNIVDRLARSDAGRAAPRAGDTLAPFLLPDDGGRLVGSDELLARGPLVLSMNRGHWCAFCRHELEGLQQIAEAVRQLGGNIVAITPERQAFAKAFKARCALDFPLLCDIDNAYSVTLGLAVWCGEEIQPLLRGFGIDLAIYQGNPGWIVPVPATYVVASDGRIADAFVDVDFRRRMEPGRILDVLRAL